MKSTLSIKIIALFLFSSSFLQAQAWEKLYTEIEGTFLLSARRVLPLSNGEYLVLLSSVSHYLAGEDYALMRTDAFGEILQLKYIETTIADVAFEMIPLADGGVVLAANFVNPIDNKREITFVKVDIDFNIVTQTFIGNSNTNEFGTDILKRDDGGYWMAGLRFAGTQVTSFLKQIDDNGLIVNEINEGLENFSASKILALPNGNIKIPGVRNFFGDHDIVAINEYNSNGELVDTKSYADPTGGFSLNSANLTSDGGIILGTTRAHHTPILIRVDAAGQELWRKEYEEHAFYLDQVIESGNGYRVLFQEDNMPYGRGAMGLLQIDATGLDVWDRIYSDNFRGWGLDILQLPDQGTLISGYRTKTDVGNYQIPYLVRTDAEGYSNRSFISGEVTTDINDDCVGDDYSLSEGIFIRAYQDGVQMGSGVADAFGKYDLTLGPGAYALQFEESVLWTTCIDPIELTLGAQDTLTNQDFDVAYFEEPMDSIFGCVFEDLDEDCIKDSFEVSGQEGWIVTMYLSDNLGGLTFVDTTDENGFYNFKDLAPLTNVIWGIIEFEQPIGTGLNCYTNCVDSLIGPFGATAVEINHGVHCDTLPLCPIMNVSIGAWGLRPCMPETYFVSYCNIGGVTSADTYLEIEIDSALTITGSSIPWTSQVGNFLTFDVPDLQSTECASFQIEFDVPCDDLLGTTYCSSVYAYPDSTCAGPGANWDGSEIQVSSVCLGDSIQFRIENIGTGNMMEAREYIIIEDNVLLFTAPQPFDLEAGELYKFSVQVEGSFYRLVAEQGPGFPGSKTPTTWVEGCGNGMPNFGFTNQYPLGDQDPWYDVFCIESVNSYDPNDKTGFPRGVSDEHFIDQNEPIEYLIRFQNTGTAEAINIEIKDALATEFLDLSTLRPGSSSHPYTWNVEGNGTLVFNFDQINLPHSTQDLEGSQGYVSFKINQHPDLPIGTQILNTAAIYFDFNPPIITNETLHTIGENLFTGTTLEPDPNHPVLSIHPNPFHDWIILDAKDQYKTQELDFHLFNTLGERIWSSSINDGAQLLPPSRIIPGIYFYEIINENKVVQTGKLIRN